MLLRKLDTNQLGSLNADSFIENTLFRKGEHDKIEFTQAGADLVSDVLNTMIKKKIRFPKALKDLVTHQGVDPELTSPTPILHLTDDELNELGRSYEGAVHPVALEHMNKR